VSADPLNVPTSMSDVDATMSGRLDPSEESETLLSRRAVGRLAGLLYVGCGLVVIASVPLPQPPGANRPDVLALGSAAVLIGSLALIAPWARWRRGMSLWLVPPALALIAAANAVGGYPFFSYDIFFVVVFVWIGICHPPRISLFLAPLATVAYVVPMFLIGRHTAAGVSSAAEAIPVCVLVGESLSWVSSRYTRGRYDIRESRQQYSALVELSPDAIFVHSDHRLVFANLAGMKLLGADNVEQLIGRPVLDVVAPEYRQIVRARVREEVEEGRTVPLVEERFVRLDGTQVDVEVAGTAITYEGKRAGLIVVRDITDRKRAEATLQQSIEALRQADRERRRLLAHLVKAQEEERQRLAADVHDDTIQVMTAVAMRLDLLEGRLTPAQLSLFDRTAETVHRALERLRHLIFELRPAVLDREGLVSAIAAYLSDAEGSDQGLQVHLDNRLHDEPPEQVRVIAYRIAQEALGNVRKHARATHLSVVLEPLDGGIRVEIRDDGIGVSTAAVHESPPGHLGLTAMRERAEVAGGWFKVQTAPDGGTLVEFWLPSADGLDVTKLIVDAP
jgi:PAS domain S-box-containing protein